ncbi:MAG TPA: ribokinase [Pirellulaceae bacterium]|nr:ribokinase [Pirellulaceae bacterium]HMO90930.1 ribokinase [Pirellulaceae bacterium]HMP69829.1 ribokinase [Pirellulaceae bacterium]
MGRVLVLGSSNTDLVLTTDHLPTEGQTVLGRQFFKAAGGKGANQAVAAARTGAQVVFVGAVGTDEYGNDSLSGLSREGIDVQFVKQVAGIPSGVAMIMVDRQGRNLIGVAAGANSCVDEELINSLPETLFTQADVVVAQLEIPRNAVRAAFERARRSGATTLLNPAPIDRCILDEQLLTLVDILVLNEPEALALCSCSIEAAQDWNQVIDTLLTKGPRAVILTRGKDGYLLGMNDERVSASSYPVRAVDTVGAGDTFVGVLAARMAEDDSLFESARWANAAAALSVTQSGAQPSIPHREAIHALMINDGPDGTP